MIIEAKLLPERDTDNSRPTEITFYTSEDGGSIIFCDNDRERDIAFKTSDIEKLVKIAKMNEVTK